MLVYNTFRILKFLELKKECVRLDRLHFGVVVSKTGNGLRKGLISGKALPFYKA
ncbi:MAG: hypothetical protein MSB10_04085 [Clostridiales bacterium]|nr:hypothetical protein [Clostridiales bacterium]